MRVAFIVKSNIKNKRLFYEQVERLRNRSIFDKMDIFETEHAQHAIELAHKTVFSDFNYVIAVGGDGTLNEVVNGLLGTGLPAEQLPAVGILPFGSANDFSRGLGITADFDKLESMIHFKKSRFIDVGEVNYVDEDGVELSRYFINVLDAGIGAVVVKKVNSSSKPLGAAIAFLKAITESFLTYFPSKVKYSIGDKTMENKILTLVVANGNYFGNGLCIAPDAKIDDNAFQVVCIHDISIADYVLNLRKLTKKKRIDHPKISYHKANFVNAVPLEHSLSVEVDGEYLGYAPIRVKVLHNRIRFLYEIQAGE